MAPCRRIVKECVADVEVAEKRFHVPATSLEALSANRRHCWDMEALLSGFHAGDVGVGVIGCGRACSFGCMGCVHVPTSWVVVVLSEYDISAR